MIVSVTVLVLCGRQDQQRHEYMDCVARSSHLVITGPGAVVVEVTVDVTVLRRSG